jgi:hypothetical protein
MLRMSKQKASEIDHAKRFLKMHDDEIRKKYAVEGSAIGYKIKDGKYTDTVALIFYVKKKKSKEELLSEGISPIPEKMDDIPTDVVVMSKGFRPR